MASSRSNDNDADEAIKSEDEFSIGIEIYSTSFHEPQGGNSANELGAMPSLPPVDELPPVDFLTFNEGEDVNAGNAENESTEQFTNTYAQAAPRNGHSSASVAGGVPGLSFVGDHDAKDAGMKRRCTSSDSGSTGGASKRRTNASGDDRAKKPPKNAGKIGVKYKCGKCGMPRRVPVHGPNGEDLGEIPHECPFISVHGPNNEALKLTASYNGLISGIQLANGSGENAGVFIPRNIKICMMQAFMLGMDVMNRMKTANVDISGEATQDEDSNGSGEDGE